MLELTINISILAAVLSLVLCLIRLFLGPTLPDRVVAADTMSTNVVALITLFCIKQESSLFYDSILVLSILGFVSTLILAKFLARGDKIFH